MIDKQLEDIIVEFAENVMEWKNGKNEDLRGNLLYDGDRSGTITGFSRGVSKHGNKVVVVHIKLDDGEELNYYITFADNCIYYIYNNFFKPLGIREFSEHSNLQDFIDYPYTDLVGREVGCKTKYDDKGNLMITELTDYDY